MNYNKKEYALKLNALLSRPKITEEGDFFYEAQDALQQIISRKGEQKGFFEIPGFPILSKAIWLRVHLLILLTGPSGVGKSLIIYNLMLALSKSFNIALLPFEMGALDSTEILASVLLGKRFCDLTKEDLIDGNDQLLKGFFANPNNVISKQDGRQDMFDCLCEMLFLYTTKNITIFFLDTWNYSQDPGTGPDALAKNEKAFHLLVTFVKRLPVTVFLVAHPRKSESSSNSDRVNSISEVRGSSSLTQESQVVLLFNRLADPKDAPPLVHPSVCREITIAKSRFNGRSVGSKIIIQTDQNSERFSEYKVKQ